MSLGKILFIWKHFDTTKNKSFYTKGSKRPHKKKVFIEDQNFLGI